MLRIRAATRIFPCLVAGTLACSGQSNVGRDHRSDLDAAGRSGDRGASSRLGGQSVASGSSSRPVPVASAAPLPPPSAEPTALVPIPDDHMVKVPAGPFFMGCAAGDDACKEDERPRHRVVLSAYWIDIYEVTVKDYRACVERRECAEPALSLYPRRRNFEPKCNWYFPERANHPVNCVDERNAADFCHWRGKRLPTEAEWERAARGTDERVYPWGNDELPDAACMYLGITCEVGAHPKGISPVGAQDMAGNVAEWVSDAYSRRYYVHSPAKDPKGHQGPLPLREACTEDWPCSIRRGGSFWDGLGAMRTSARKPDMGPDDTAGIRCARSDD